MAFLDENGLAHLWQGLKGKFLALTGGNSFGNVKATGAIGAGYRLYTGDSEGTTSGTPGAVITNTGDLVLKSASDARLMFYPDGKTSASRTINVSSTQFAFNDDVAVTGSVSATDRLSFAGWNIPYIQHGNISVSATNGESTNFTISFPKSFPGTPDVVITPRHNSTGADYELTVRLRTVSASNATGVIYCDGGTATWVIHWTAMYG